LYSNLSYPQLLAKVYGLNNAQFVGLLKMPPTLETTRPAVNPIGSPPRFDFSLRSAALQLSKGLLTTQGPGFPMFPL
jgi:hypothetical protein